MDESRIPTEVRNDFSLKNSMTSPFNHELEIHPTRKHKKQKNRIKNSRLIMNPIENKWKYREKKTCTKMPYCISYMSIYYNLQGD